MRELVREIAREGRISHGTKVCDIGCGYGATARMLAVEFEAEVTANTISPAQHACGVSQQADAPGVSYVLGDWLESDLPDGIFDVAIAIESSEHMPNVARFFAQARRVLRTDGRLVVSAWLAGDGVTPIQRRWLNEPICREGHMPQMGTVADYRRLASDAGFAEIRFRDLTREVSRTWPVMLGIFARRLLSNPRYVRFAFGTHARNRQFGLAAIRIWLAYRIGAMRYGMFTFIGR